MTDGDPSAMSAWLIAIPTTLTAVSTWYLNRKSAKNHETTKSVTQDAISTSETNLTEQISSLKDRVARLEMVVTETKSSQLMISAKFTESMNALSLDLQRAKAAFEKAVPRSSLPDSGTSTAGAPAGRLDPSPPEPSPAKTTVKVIDVPTTGVGKVKWDKS